MLKVKPNDTIKLYKYFYSNYNIVSFFFHFFQNIFFRFDNQAFIKKTKR